MQTVLPYRPLERRPTTPSTAVAPAGMTPPAPPTYGGSPGTRPATSSPMPVTLAPPPTATQTPSATVQPITGQERPTSILPPSRNVFSLPNGPTAPGAGSYSAGPATRPPQMDSLQAIMSRLQGGGGSFLPTVSAAAPGSSPMMDELLGQIRAQLTNPSPFDEEAYKASEAQVRESIDGQYTRDKDALEAQLAERGLGWGSTAASELGTLAKGKVENFNSAMVPLLRERAQMIANQRNAATQAGLSLAGLEQQQQAEAARAANSASQTNAQMMFQAALAEMDRQGQSFDRFESTRRYDQGFGEDTRRFDLNFGEDVRRTNEDLGYRDRTELRGERGYVDTLRNTARDQAMEEAMLGENVRSNRNNELFRFLTAGMGSDDGSMDALRLALGGYGDQAATAGQQAGQYGDWLSQLATQVGYRYGGG